MAQKFVGVDLGSHHIKVSVVSAGLRGVQVIDAFEEPVGHPAPPAEGEEAPDPLAHQLSVALSALRSRGLLRETMGLCLPAPLVSYRVLSFPFADERRIAQAVAFEADDKFPVPLSELSHGHAVVPAPDGGGRALLVAARSERLEQIVSVFKRAGAEIKVATSGALAAAQVSAPELPAPSPQLTEQGLRPAALLLDLGHNYTHFVALGPKGPLALRTLRRGSRHITEAVARHYKVDAASAEVSKHTDAFLPHRGFTDITGEQMEAGKLVAAALEPILRELEHTRLWLRATYHLEVDHLVVSGGGAGLNGLEAYLTEHTGLDCKPLTIKAPGLKLPSGKDWRSTAGALGAAYGAARRPLVQLFDDVASDTEGAWLQERMSGLIALGVAVMAFGALDTIAQVKAAEAELGAYEDQLAVETERVFGESVPAAGVSARLAEAEGQDLMSLIPDRGGLEILALITRAATPSDLGTAPAPAVGSPTAFDGSAPEGPDGAAVPPVPGAPDSTDGTSAAPATIPMNAGIVVADQLTIEQVDIRERKIEIKASANFSSTQDRLNFKLSQIGCISNISNGKVRGDARKTFEMEMDNACFKAAPVEEEPDASESADSGDAEDEEEAG